MPSSLETPVLTVDANTIHRIDTRNVENLFSIWTVFSRCAGSIEEGRRLENLSWRLWTRETFCCAPGEANATTPAISISKRSSEGTYGADLPELSGSVDSLQDNEEAIASDNEESSSTSAPLNIARPKIQRQDSGSTRSRGRERHITPDDLEKMVITIKEKKDLEPLALSTHSYLAPLQPKAAAKLSNVASPFISAPEEKQAPSTSSASQASSKSNATGSTDAASEQSATSIVRGFSPAQVSLSYRSIPLLNAPASLPKSAMASGPKTGPKHKKHTMFALGGSSQSDNDSYGQESSLEARIAQSKLNQQKKVFQLGGSSGDDSSLRDSMSLKQAQRSSLGPSRPFQKKQTSFREELASKLEENNDVFETDDEDEIDESAIDDDDSSDWEDSIAESGRSSFEEKKLSFPRVDSRPNLTSRRSLITTLLHQNDRAAALQRAASKSTSALNRSRTTSPQGPSMPASVESDDEESAPLTMKNRLRPNEVPRSDAQPIIMTTTNNIPHQAALSPRTTRRQMLATELTPSLRRNLLWERQQKNQTASAVLKRRHTSHDVAHLKQYPEKVHLGADAQNDHEAYNQYFGVGLGEYHTKGW